MLPVQPLATEINNTRWHVSTALDIENSNLININSLPKLKFFKRILKIRHTSDVQKYMLTIFPYKFS